MATTLDALKAEFDRKHGQQVFPRKLAPAIATYFHDTLGLKTMEEVVEFGHDGFEAALGELGSAPAPFIVAALAWFDYKEPVAGPKTSREGGKKTMPPTSSRMVGAGLSTTFADTDDEWDEESIMGGDVKPASAMQEYDEARLKLTGAQITALYRSVYSGQIQAEDECEGISYGSDCTQTEWARKLIKSEVEPVTKLLAKGDYGLVKEHFVTLIRDYNGNGMTREVTIITTFLTAAEEMFTGDDKGLCAYIAAYMKKYKGRAFPKEVDLRLVVKSLRQNGMGAVRDEMKSLTSKVAKLDVSVSSVESKVKECSSLSSKVQSLAAKVDRNTGPRKPPDDGESEDKKCGYCQEFGHFYRNCPKRKADEAAKAKKKEEEEG